MIEKMIDWMKWASRNGIGALYSHPMGTFLRIFKKDMVKEVRKHVSYKL